jgi:hypothetical protein
MLYTIELVRCNAGRPGASMLVVVIACSNITSLILARTVRSENELTILDIYG